MQKNLLSFLIVCSLFSCGGAMASETFYSEDGQYQGRMDDNGYIYDKTGLYQGRIDYYGNIYDRIGSLRGKIDKEGNFYDKKGNFVGKQAKKKSSDKTYSG